MLSAEREPIGQGQSYQRGPGLEPPVSGQGLRPLKEAERFLHYHNLRSRPIILKSAILKQDNFVGSLVVWRPCPLNPLLHIQ